MAATARSTSKPKPVRRPAPLVPAGDDDLVDIPEPDPEAEPDRVPVFKIGDTVHTMLADPGPSVALRAMELAEQRGATPLAVGFADVFIMREMLGGESYRALLNCKAMTRGQYLRIVGKVMRRAMGALEDDGSPNL